MRRRFLILLAAGVCAVCAACRKAVAPGPDVWAVVDGKEITRGEVEKYYRTRLNPQGPPPSHEEALSLKMSILDELVSNEILLERAHKLSLVATDAEVEDKFTESKSPYTEEEFQKKLKDNSLTVDDLKADLRRQISIQKLLNREVVSKITITDDDVKNFYEQNRAQFDLAEPQFHIAQIVITPRSDPTVHNRKNDKASSEVGALRKAAELEQKLNGGADFIQLAMDYSEDPNASSGGDLGFIPESSLNQADPALKHAVLSLHPGEVSGPIRVRGGEIRILKMIAKESAGQRQISDPQVQTSIRDALRNRKEQLMRIAYLAIARDQSHVTNYLAPQILESAGKLPADETQK